jgi:hypothetical protein
MPRRAAAGRSCSWPADARHNDPVATSRRRVLGLVLAGIVVMAGCVTLAWAPWRADYDVDGPVVAATRDEGTSLQALLGGRLALVDGCLRLEGDAVVWPVGTWWDEGRRAVVLRDGTLLRDGDVVRGGGGSFGGDDPEFGGSDAARALGRCWVAGQTVDFFNASETVELSE